MKKQTATVILSVTALLSGCGSFQSAKVDPLPAPKKYEDASASCYQLQAESDKMLAEVQEIVETNTHNDDVARKRQLAFAPITIPLILSFSLAGVDLGERDLSNIKKRQERIKHLQSVMLEKGCSGKGANANSPATPSAPKEKSRVIICAEGDSCVVE